MNALSQVGGDAYDDFMGRYSQRLAPLFADFAHVESGSRGLDVGAGTGALTAELLSRGASVAAADPSPEFAAVLRERFPGLEVDRKSIRLNSSHPSISYAVFCLKKKKKKTRTDD